ncbi:transposase [Geotalea sp. SG265]|uniref:transposase n=1 Tax=Geotalea sp. SG265 TaxID=2922867 RepID=UPI001FAEEB3A|nr:transposase [Geotalea sp. SG265]
MARPLRIEYPGAVYHVTSRGNARADIYTGDADRGLFLKILGQVVRRFNWVCHAYCLMDNHYHLLVETPEGNLSAGMRQLNGVYTQAFNRECSRDGHIFKGRFKAILVEKESHLLELCRYVVLNPIRAHMVDAPEKYRWSSYLATIGKVPKEPCLTTAWVLSNFSGTASSAMRLYKSFVHDGIGLDESPWERLAGQIVLGTEQFIERIRGRFDNQETLPEIPRVQRNVGRPALVELFNDHMRTNKGERNVAIALAHGTHGYTLKEIAEELGLHYTTISKVINREK